MAGKIIFLLFIALYFTGCADAKKSSAASCENETCLSASKEIPSVWSNGVETFDFRNAVYSSGDYNSAFLQRVPFQMTITDAVGVCIMRAVLVPADWLTDGMLDLESNDTDCEQSYGGSYKYSHKNNNEYLGTRFDLSGPEVFELN